MKKFFFFSGLFLIIVLGFLISGFFPLYQQQEDWTAIWEWAVLLGMLSGIILEIVIQIGESKEWEEGYAVGGVFTGTLFQAFFFLLLFSREESGRFLEIFGILLLLSLVAVIVFSAAIIASVFLTRFIIYLMDRVIKKI